MIVMLIAGCKGNSNEAKTGEAKEIATTDSVVAEQYVVEAGASELKWVSTKISGKTHDGHVPVSGGTVGIMNGKIGSGKFGITIAGLSVDDIKDPADNKDLVEHLRDTDFFSAMQYPMGEFSITSVKYTSEDSAIVAGNLTIKGISNNIEFPALIHLADGKLTAAAKFSIDRTKWGLSYHAGKSWKDKMILDNIDFDLKLEANKH